MSWQLASGLIVMGALALAFWWYERSRPSAKLLALVATLAAFAALGRDAFAAVPDVKPTSAIVLIAGLAFGAGPGFAVGALGALASNVLLGQGPWTPWQMLAWGAVGALGALLARLGGRRMPRLALALAGAAAAELYNLILDLYTWTAAGSHTAAAFGVVLSAAAVFDITHVVATFVFAFAFGPALLRMLMRARARLHVSWLAPESRQARERGGPSAGGALPGAARALAVLLALLLAAGAMRSVPSAHAGGGGAGASGTSARLVAFLESAQNEDGGFGSARGQPSTELYTAWAAIGLAAAGRAPLGARRAGHTPLDALRREAGELRGAGDLERTIVALRACGASVHAFPGGDPVARLLRSRARDGSFEELVNITAFAVFALRAAGHRPGEPLLASAARWISRQQEGDGGFGFAARGGGSDVDDTAAAVQALLDAGVRGVAVARAVRFLRAAQNADGGFPQRPGGSSNAQSSAWAVQALAAAGVSPASVARSGRSPLSYLAGLVAPGGSVRYSRTGTQTPVWVTAQALTALAQKPFPIAPVPAARTTVGAALSAHSAPAASAPATGARARAGGRRRPARLASAGPRGAERIARAAGALVGSLLAGSAALDVSS